MTIEWTMHPGFRYGGGLGFALRSESIPQNAICHLDPPQSLSHHQATGGGRDEDAYPQIEIEIEI
jgi:hypothetical protein